MKNKIKIYGNHYEHFYEQGTLFKWNGDEIYYGMMIINPIPGHIRIYDLKNKKFYIWTNNWERFKFELL